MGIMEQTLPYERDLFFFINGHHSPFWDTFMWIYSGKLIWVPLLLACLFCFVYKMKWRESLLLIVSAVLVGVLCDQISASIIKPAFERFRPTNHPDFASLVQVVNGYRGGRFGFVSNHAANGFGVATFASLIFKKRYLTITMFVWALITCYSRVYLGVHFPTDILGGMIVGVVCGLFVFYLYRTMRKLLLNLSHRELHRSALEPYKAKVMVATFILTVVFLVIYGMLNPTMA